jgi:hypothetical protein
MKKSNGGYRPGAGRKRKEEEQVLVEKLKPYEQEAFNALVKGLREGRDWAVKLFFSYRFGLPKQDIKLDGNMNYEIIDKVINNGKQS